MPIYLAIDRIKKTKQTERQAVGDNFHLKTGQIKLFQVNYRYHLAPVLGVH